MDVHSESGTTGASYIWVDLPRRPGRAGLARPRVADVTAGTWQHVDTATVPHEWQLVDLSSGQTVAAETSTPAEFVTAHGDGAGQS